MYPLLPLSQVDWSQWLNFQYATSSNLMKLDCSLDASHSSYSNLKTIPVFSTIDQIRLCTFFTEVYCTNFLYSGPILAKFSEHSLNTWPGMASSIRSLFRESCFYLHSFLSLPRLCQWMTSPKISFLLFHDITEPNMQRLKPSLCLLALNVVGFPSKGDTWGSSLFFVASFQRHAMFYYILVLFHLLYFFIHSLWTYETSLNSLYL